MGKSKIRAGLALLAGAVLAVALFVVMPAIHPALDLGPALMPEAFATGLGDIAGTHQTQASIVTSSADASTGSWVVFRAPFACRVKQLSFVPAAAIVANSASYFTLDIQNAGSAGTGTTSLVTTYSSTAAVAVNDEQIWTLSTTDATISLASGDVLFLKKTVTNGGNFFPPALLVLIQYEPK